MSGKTGDAQNHWVYHSSPPDLIALPVLGMTVLDF